MNRLSFVAFALVLAACGLDLPDGYYACSSGACPPHWFCHADKLCYRTPEGVSQKSLFDACTAGSAGDAQCMSGLCAAGPDPTASTGQCSTTCTGDTTCPGAPDAWCLDGECVGTCSIASDCPSGLGCFMLATRGGRACFAVDDPHLAGTVTCTSAADCDPKAPCLLDPAHGNVGVCAWPCAGPNDACPANSECTDVSMLNGASATGFACLTRCGTCPSALTCLKFPGNSKHCVPAAW